MTFIKKTLSVLLSFSILISALFVQLSFNVSAASQKGVVVNINDSLNIREEAKKSSKSLGKIYNGYSVQVNGEGTGDTVTDSDISGSPSSNKWYNITYNGITGWVSSLYINIIPDYTYDGNFENHISAFPESYKPYLRELHAQYPNWRFYPDNINMTLEEAVTQQVIDIRKLTSADVSWRYMGAGGYDWSTGTWMQPEPKYYAASREVVRYYMDPRSYLNSVSVFAFLPQNYDANAQTEAGVQKIIKGTFMEKNYNDPNDTAYGGSYSKVLMAAAKASNVNPYVLAATIIQEQGTAGTSPLISGNYGGYENLYNFFNVGATGSTKEEIYKNGLSRARTEKWTTRSASIIGGASFCANNYINANQNTYYYMNFNVKEPSRLWHQYAQAIHDTYSKASKVSASYKDLTDAEISFLIPVYKNMPSEVSKEPEKNGKMNNYYFNSISVSGLTPSFNKFTYNYDLNVWGDTNINVTVPENATYVGATSFSLNMGQNTVVLTVKSQSGYTNNYTLNVRADKACTITVNGTNTATPSYKKGDTNGDGQINGRDLANVQMHILSVKALTGSGFTAADTNGDGQINGRDLANVQMDILGVKKLN